MELQGRVRSLSCARFQQVFFKSDAQSDELIQVIYEKICGQGEQWSRTELQMHCAWPRRRSVQRKYYKPLIGLLQAIQREILPDALGLYGRGRFDAHDDRMKQRVREAFDTPDGFLVSKVQEDVNYLRNVHMPIEVNNDWRNLIKEVATAARAMFCHQPCQRFVPALILHYRLNQAKLCIFTRNGMIMTPAMFLSTSE